MIDKLTLYKTQISKILNYDLLLNNSDILKSVDVNVLYRENTLIVGIDLLFTKRGDDNTLRERLGLGIHTYLTSVTSMVITESYCVVGWLKLFTSPEKL